MSSKSTFHLYLSVMPLLKKLPSLFPALTPNFLADSKSNERVFRAMEKVIRLCQHEKIQLKNSPPYILEILPELYPLLQTAIKHVLSELSHYNVSNDKQFMHGTSNTATEIPVFLPEYLTDLWDKHKIPLHLANAALYLKLFLTNTYLKCRDVVQLFKDDEQLVELSDPRSKAREKLSHISLLLSNMWKEFEAMFVVSVAEEKSIFIGCDFKITKHEGAVFWDQNFRNQCIVHWTRFATVFTNSRDTFNIVTPQESERLKATFDITENGYVSIFEFDIFVRLFHPFRNLIHNWYQISSHPAYMGFKTYDEICAILGKHTSRPGSYVFRVSCTKLGQWSIGYVDSHGKILQTIPSTPTLIEALKRGVEDRYYLYPNGEDFNPDLKAEIGEVEKVMVSMEDQQIYHLMDSTYEECKLCYERQKDTRIEPCGHLICRQCLEQIRKQAKAECPWCRHEIRANVNVSIQPSAAERERAEEVVFGEINQKDVNGDQNVLGDLKGVKKQNKDEGKAVGGEAPETAYINSFSTLSAGFRPDRAQDSTVNAPSEEFEPSSSTRPLPNRPASCVLPTERKTATSKKQNMGQARAPSYANSTMFDSQFSNSQSLFVELPPELNPLAPTVVNGASPQTANASSPLYINTGSRSLGQSSQPSTSASPVAVCNPTYSSC